MNQRIICGAAIALISLSGLALGAPKTPTRALDVVLPEMRFTNVTLSEALEFLRDVSGANVHVNWKALEAAGITRETNVNVRLRGVTLRKALAVTLNDAAGGDTLTFYQDQGVLEITTKDLADRKMYTKVYPVEDLIMDIPTFTGGQSLSLAGGGNSFGGNTSGTSGSSMSSGRGGSGYSGSGIGSGTSNNNTSGSGSNSSSQSKQQRADDLVQMIMDIIRPEIWSANGGPASIRFWNGTLIVTAPRSVHEAILSTGE